MMPAEERLFASRPYRSGQSPFFTIAIPHYKHRQYLEQALDSIFEQSTEDLEIVVSNDASPDDSNDAIPVALHKSGRAFRYYVQPQNLGYDGNLRFCLASARGRYILTLGNDDALAGPDTLAKIGNMLRQLGLPDAAFTNYEYWTSPGSVVQRAVRSEIVGTGPEAAIRFFRTFSYFGGLIFRREAAKLHETDLWDKSVYYQIYLACRILAAGGRLGALNVSAVRKDIHVADSGVPNYATKWSNAPWSFQVRHTGLDSVLRVAAAAVQPWVPRRRRSATIRRMASQILLISYPYWLFEYRRISNWSFAVGVARGLWPSGLLAEYDLSKPDRLKLWLLYLMVTLAGLTVPASLFNRIRGRLAHIVRYIRQ